MGISNNLCKLLCDKGSGEQQSFQVQKTGLCFPPLPRAVPRRKEGIWFPLPDLALRDGEENRFWGPGALCRWVMVRERLGRTWFGLLTLCLLGT